MHTLPHLFIQTLSTHGALRTVPFKLTSAFVSCKPCPLRLSSLQAATRSQLCVEAWGSLKELARATTASLQVTPSRCVLLSPAGDRLAHTQNLPETQLAEGDVVTVVVLDVPKVFLRIEKVERSRPSKEMAPW